MGSLSTRTTTERHARAERVAVGRLRAGPRGFPRVLGWTLVVLVAMFVTQAGLM
ncbi:SCO1431 family membrane protein [Streptomyces sp. NPDC005166]